MTGAPQLPSIVFAAAADEHAPAVTHTQSNAHFLDTGIDKDAFRLVEKTPGYSIGLVDNVGKHRG